MRPADPVRASTFVASYSLDGLIDEVRVYDRPLRAEEIAQAFRRMRPPVALVSSPDMDPRKLPATAALATDRGHIFGARSLRLPFYESWDALWRFGEHADVVVTFQESPCRFVFWRGMGYIPALVNEKDQWYSNEFNETWGRSGGIGCQEPMSDKEAYSNRVSVLENTPARVVVLWRYPLKDVLHVHANYREETGWSDWADWYYTIYPDGVAAKRMRLWTDGPRNHEWHEAMAILGPGQHPEEVLETDPALLLGDLDGNAERLSWVGGPPRAPSYRGKQIHVVNYRAEYDPFTIGDFVGGDVYSGEVTAYSVFPSWNHWPVAQIPSDGRYASFPDRTAHSSLTHVRLPDHASALGDRPYQEKVLLEGLTRKSPSELATLARSWLSAPELTHLVGGAGGAYDRGERAYALAARSTTIAFRIEASRDRPLQNPCFVVRNWGHDGAASVALDGERLAEALESALARGHEGPREGPSQGVLAFRQGIVRDPAGIQQLAVWIALEAARPVDLSISGARPTDVSGEATALRWTLEPRPLDGAFAAEMEVAPLSAPGRVEYLFERLDLERETERGAEEPAGALAGPHVTASGWQDAPRYVDTGLRPEARYAYRSRARTRYFEETEWSPRVVVRTPAAPPPATWSFDEGSGARVHEASGRFPGEIRGNAVRVPGRVDKALRLDGGSSVVVSGSERLRTSSDFTWTAWVRCDEGRGGAIIARAGAGERWVPGGKVLFIVDGVLSFDVGWVGVVRASRVRVADGDWHHVAVTISGSRAASVRFYVDGKPAGGGTLDVAEHPEEGLPFKIGACNEDFPGERPGFEGDLDDVRWYGHAVDEAQLSALYRAAGE